MAKKEDIRNLYLEKYKKLEELLKQSQDCPDSIFDLETSYDNSKEAEKLKLCRLVRNYLQHNVDLFIEPTIEMTNFLDEEIFKLESKFLKVKDQYTRAKAISEDLTFKEAILLLNTKNFLPVVNKDNLVIGTFDDTVIRKSIKNNKLNNKIKTNKDFLAGVLPFISMNDNIKDIENGSYIVTLNGNKSEKYKGIFER